MTEGVYAIRNIVNGDEYIGSSIHIQLRWEQHRLLLNRREHFNLHLQSAWNKYEQRSFEFLILYDLSDNELLDLENCSRLDLQESCLEVEQQYLDQRRPKYNKQKTARSPLTIRKMSPTQSREHIQKRVESSKRTRELNGRSRGSTYIRKECPICFRTFEVYACMSRQTCCTRECADIRRRST